MTLFVVLFHVIACLTLILVVLLQAGSESGLSGAFGGGASDSVFGAKSNTFLTRFTTVMAVIFMISSLSLAVIAAKKNKSVVMSKAAGGPITQASVAKMVEDLKEEAEDQSQKTEDKNTVEETTAEVKEEVVAETATEVETKE